VAKGDLGSKTGKGIYSWSPEEVTAWKKRMSENLIHFMVGDSEKAEGEVAIWTEKRNEISTPRWLGNPV